MSNGQGHGGSKPPQDDRTLLDPLSNDELRALREARQRMQAKKEPTSAVAHQIVIGPDSGEDIGDAPTRAIPSLPSFEGNVSLEHISAPPGPAGPEQRVTEGAVDPATVPTVSQPPRPAASADPRVGYDQSETVAMASSGHSSPGSAEASSVPTAPPHPSSAPPPGGAHPTQPGFGENTLLWMQPPKQAPMPQTGSHNVADFFPRASRQEVNTGRLKTVAVTTIALLLAGAFLYLVLFASPKGILELHSVPTNAKVYIDDNQYGATPVKLTLSEGSYRISLRLDGHEPAWVTANVQGDQSERKEVALTPLSQPGRMTVKIEVQPVAARIKIDGKTHADTRVLMVPNVDPNVAHKIEIEAPGYVKIVQEIRKEELKSSYSFVLAKPGP